MAKQLKGTMTRAERLKGTMGRVSRLKGTMARAGRLRGTVVRGDDDLESVTFQALISSTGLSLLPSTMTLGGVTQPASTRYIGTAASPTSWPGGIGPTLPVLGGGTAPVIDESPFLDGSKAVRFAAGGQSFKDTGSSVGDIGIGDFVLEVLLRKDDPGPASGFAAGKGITPGWRLIERTGVIGLRMEDGVISSEIQIPYAFPLWSHYLWIISRTTDISATYINGIRQFTGPTTSSIGSLSNVAGLTIGDDTGVANDVTVGMLQIFERAGWYSDITDADEQVRAHVAAMFGIEGAAASAGQLYPLSWGRASSGYLDRLDGVDRKMFPVAPNWPIVVSRPTKTGSDVVGLLIENKETNPLFASEAIEAAAWTKTNATIDDDAVAAPDPKKLGDGIVASSTSVESKSVSQAVGGADPVLSVWAKPGAVSHIGVRHHGGALADSLAIFSLTGAGAVTFQGTDVVSAHIEPGWFDGWYRCIVRGALGTALTELYAVNGPDLADVSYAAADAVTAQVFVWGTGRAEELGAADRYASSYVPTPATASATRVSDEPPVWKADDGNVENTRQGSIEAKVLYEDYTVSVEPQFVNLADNGTEANRIGVGLDATGNIRGQVDSAETGPGDIVSTSKLGDGDEHTITLTWAEDDFRLYDGVAEIAMAASGTAPDDIDEIEVGVTRSIVDRRMQGVLTELTIKKLPVAP